jgi:hypothetical protein
LAFPINPISKGPFPSTHAISGWSGKGPSGGSGSSGGGSGSSGCQGANNSRQGRAAYNAWRRSGDCLALDVPNIVLWMDEELALEDEPLY